jgi:hypothetical protein
MTADMNKILAFFRMPVVVFNRIAPSDSGTLKRRHVYCPPFAVTVIEAIYGGSLLSYFKDSDSCIFIGRTQLQISQHVQSRKDLFQLSLDFKRFDLSIPSYLIFLAFDLIKQVLVLTPKHSYLYDKLVEYICFAHVYHPRVGTVLRRRGLISGSYFTNLLDSVINTIVIVYALISTDQLKHIVGMSVHGDDN